MRISFIISTFARPQTLLACLTTLALQTEKDSEFIVTDNTRDLDLAEHNAYFVKLSGSRFKYVRTLKEECYSSAEDGVRLATGKYIAFPSDDDFIVPAFGELMANKCDTESLDFTYSDGIYDDWNGKRYNIFNTEPRVNRIDKCSFLMRREIFTEFPNKARVSDSDGRLVEELVRKGYRHSKTDGILWVHC